MDTIADFFSKDDEIEKLKKRKKIRKVTKKKIKTKKVIDK